MAVTELSLKGLNEVDWLDELDLIGEDEGYFEKLGPDHVVLFAEDGPKLLVHFDTMDNARLDSPDGLPVGMEVLPGWSHLVILSRGETWFRAPQVFGYFDRLIDDGFLEDFDQVVFMGSGPAGYAAAAFSVAAPGAHVLAFAPQATLDPAFAGWDRRHLAMRRTSFTDRFGFAPDMLEGAADAFIFYDPEITEDAVHAALFRRPHVMLVPSRFSGEDLMPLLVEKNVLGPMIEAAAEGRLDRRAVANALRVRRRHLPYVQALLGQFKNESNPRRVANLCRHAAAQFGLPRHRRRLAQVEALLGADTRQPEDA